MLPRWCFNRNWAVGMFISLLFMLLYFHLFWIRVNSKMTWNVYWTLLVQRDTSLDNYRRYCNTSHIIILSWNPSMSSYYSFFFSFFIEAIDLWCFIYIGFIGMEFSVLFLFDWGVKFLLLRKNIRYIIRKFIKVWNTDWQFSLA